MYGGVADTDSELVLHGLALDGVGRSLASEMTSFSSPNFAPTRSTLRPRSNAPWTPASTPASAPLTESSTAAAGQTARFAVRMTAVDPVHSRTVGRIVALRPSTRDRAASELDGVGMGHSRCRRAALVAEKSSRGTFSGAVPRVAESRRRGDGVERSADGERGRIEPLKPTLEPGRTNRAQPRATFDGRNTR